MKKILILISLLAVFTAVPAFGGLTAATTGGAGYGIWQTGSGGEFTLKPGGFNPLGNYAAVAKNQGVAGTFQTFCLEEREYIYPNTTFNVVISDKAIDGGVGPAGDPISLGTAYLYHEFQNGTLAGYDYANTGVGRNASAAGLQNAIWYLEGEGGSLSAAYTNLLNTQFGSVANAKVDNNGKYGVAVLNLYDASGNKCQDQLVCVPAPGALLLGSIGLGLVGWLRRRKAV